MQLHHLARRIAAVFYAGRKQVREEWVLHRRPAVSDPDGPIRQSDLYWVL